MNTSKTSTPSFEDRCSILSQFWLEQSEAPQFQQMAQYFSTFFRMAMLINFDFVVATEKGTSEINKLWDFFLEELLGDEYHGPLESLDDIIYWSKSGLFPQEEVDRVTQQGSMM